MLAIYPSTSTDCITCPENQTSVNDPRKTEAMDPVRQYQQCKKPSPAQTDESSSLLLFFKRLFSLNLQSCPKRTHITFSIFHGVNQEWESCWNLMGGSQRIQITPQQNPSLVTSSGSLKGRRSQGNAGNQCFACWALIVCATCAGDRSVASSSSFSCGSTGAS